MSNTSYVKVTYKENKKPVNRYFTIEEITETSVPLGAMILSDNNKCEVELIECTPEVFKTFFGDGQSIMINPNK